MKMALHLCVMILVVGLTSGAMLPKTSAAALSCPAEFQITESFDNGASWEMCWEARQRENIVLSEISYTPPGGALFPVLAQLRLAQLHVAYDDSEVTFNDVTQFGLGAGFRLTLVPENCPAGELITVEGRAGICKTLSAGDDAYRTISETHLSESLTMYSVSQVGTYAYIVTWKFYADGSIEPSVGAAGALQRSSDLIESPFGRQLSDSAEKSWLSHTHTYYWHMDFDLGDSATDDVVSETTFRLDNDGRRIRDFRPLEIESSRIVQPQLMLQWRIADNAEDPANSPGYSIQPLHYGHRFIREQIEPFTGFDFFVTRQDDCERFINDNARFNPDCDENILQFVNEESLNGQDIAVWHRVSFHHVPRNEDLRIMHSHWDGFVLKASNLTSGTPGHSGIVANIPPRLIADNSFNHAVGDAVDIQLQAIDSEGDELLFTANGLPPGLEINTTGRITGAPIRDGNFSTTFSVVDSQGQDSLAVDWRIGSDNLSAEADSSPPQVSTSTSGGSGADPLWIWILFALPMWLYSRVNRPAQLDS